MAITLPNFHIYINIYIYIYNLEWGGGGGVPSAPLRDTLSVHFRNIAKSILLSTIDKW